jgi:hypothetical protein
MNQAHEDDLPIGGEMRENTSTLQKSPASFNKPLNQEQDADIPLSKLSPGTPYIALSPAKSSLPPPDEQKQTQATAVAINARSSVGWERTVQHPPLMPYNAEEQKHEWHNASLGMNSKVVMDEWGFHSTSVSRSHSPNSAK